MIFKRNVNLEQLCSPMLNQPISLSLGSLELVFASKNISPVGGELDTEQCAGVNEGL